MDGGGGEMGMKAWTVHSANTCQSQTMRVGRAKYPPYPSILILLFIYFWKGNKIRHPS